MKTGLFAIHDQAEETQPEWGDGISGFAKRVGSLQAGNIIQNSLTALGNAAVGFEPRYDRCRCEGAWPRVRHAVVRNFITYGGGDDKSNTTSGHVLCGSVWRRGDRRLVGT